METFAGLFIIPSDPHALAAAASRGFEHHRVADLVRNFHGLVGVFDQTHIARHGRDTRLLSNLFGGDLIAHLFNGANGRADESHAYSVKRLGKLAVFA